MYDILIVGSGPAGLAAAIYGKRANLSVAVIEKNYGGVGQIGEGGHVYNYPGLPGIRGFELGMKFREHAAELSVEFIEQEMMSVKRVCGENGQAGKIVSGDDRTLPRYEIQLKDGSVRESLAVVYAAGTSPKKTGLPEEEKFIAKGISYCAICDGNFYRDKTVAVLGGGDTALDEALYLSSICKKVYLIHRRNEFRGSGSTVSKVENQDNIELVLGETVSTITGEDRVDGLVLQSGRKIELQGIFVAYGSAPSTDPVKTIVQLDDYGYIKAGEDGKTMEAGTDKELPGFFAAGDVRTKHLRQVVTAVSDGANAATSAAEWISTI